MTRMIADVWNQGRAVARARWYLRDADVLGAKVRLQGKPRVINQGRMMIGDKVRLDSTAATLELVTEPNGVLDVEDHVFLNFGCNIAATKLIRIGAYSLLGPYCMLMDNSYHCVEPERRLERPESKPIILERNVWLGARTIVLPGITIGEGSCVGAGSVVTADVPPRTFVAGVPTRVVRAL
jgi:acetyltransferase-like isoleucine patch superfamily enzyme